MGKHDRTFEAIFATPTRANIRWSDAVGLLAYYGGTDVASGGSAHKFTMPNGASAVIHKPLPGNQLSRGRVEAFRFLLIRASLEPVGPDDDSEEENGHGDAEL